MRLLNTDFDFRDFDDDNVPPYAILSHTWSEKNEEEVLYQDLKDGTTKPLLKLELCRDWAKAEGFEYFWIDTCCIDKRNDAEISYAIRSMWRWYLEAGVCFVYLSDVTKKRKLGDEDWQDTLKHSRWFTRGWTLQELVVPKRVEFYAKDGHIGSKDDLLPALKSITGIDLGGPMPSHATRLGWAAKRETKRPEDKAYCMLGICDVTLDPRYGEGGETAWRRLEDAIRHRHGTTAFQVTNSEHRAVVLARLRFSTMESKRTTIKKPIAKTCKWIRSHPACSRWLKKEHKFFWIKGKPGTGKSVLIKYLDDHVTKQLRNSSSIRLYFYFSARGEQLEKSLTGLYRSLLVQLVDAVPGLARELDVLDTQLEMTKLQVVLTSAIIGLGRQIWLFIDALDECREGDVRELIEFLDGLQEAQLFVCFASRHYPIFTVPTNLCLVLEEVYEHEQDLVIYIEKLDLRGEELAQMQRDIVAKANGIFLWVVLVVETLRKDLERGRFNAMQSRLREMPEGLPDLFKTIILRDNEHREEFFLCLRWVLYACRPLTLKEWYYAMMAGVNGSLEWVEAVTDHRMETFLLSSSKGLVELTKGQTITARFIHESVREFLIHDDAFHEICGGQGSSENVAHEQLKQCCYRGMAFGLPRQLEQSKSEKQILGEDERNLLRTRHPFAEYATTYVLHHADRAAIEWHQQYFQAERFNLPDWVARYNALQKHKTKAYSATPSLTYVCAERNLTGLLTRPTDPLLFEKQQRYRTPLIAAILNSSWSVLMIFLKDMDAQDIDDMIVEIQSVEKFVLLPNSLLEQPWRWAVVNGLSRLSMHLLANASKENADANGEGDVYDIALCAASDMGHVEFVKLLLDRGSNVNMGADANGNALYTACDRGHIEVVELLLDAGADVNIREGTNDSALSAASDRGHTEIMMLLLEHGARDLDVALQIASTAGHTEATKLLLEYGARDVDGALEAASSVGETEVVKLLLEHGARDVDGALQAASSEGYSEVVKLLLEKGADVNAKGGYDGNALQIATARGHNEIVKLLLHSEAEIHVQEGDSANVLRTRTPLSISQQQEIISASTEHGSTLAPSLIGDSGYGTGSHRPTDSGEEDSDAESVRTDGTSHDVPDDYTEQLLEQLIEEAVKEILPQGLGTLANMPAKNTLRTWFRGCAVLVRNDNTAGQLQRKAATFMRHRRKGIAFKLLDALEESRSKSEPKSDRSQSAAQMQESVQEWLSTQSGEYVPPQSPEEGARSPSPSSPDEHPTAMMPSYDPKSQDEVERYKSLFRHPGFSWLTNQIRSALISQPKVQSRRLMQEMVISLLDRVPPDKPMKLVLHWVPRNFLAEQYASYEQPQLAKALVYCGEIVSGYVTTVDEYACRYWPDVARFVIDCLQQACVHGIYSSTISGVTLRVQLVALSTEVEVTGLRSPHAVDILDLCIWIALSCRAGPDRNSLTYARPRLSSKQPDLGAPMEVDITSTPIVAADDTGCCWLRMVNNPVVVQGYPIPMRSGDVKGLEMSFPIMVALSHANWATVFHEVFVLKGPFSALVPVTAMQDSVQWHFLRTATSDGERLTYNEAYAKANANITRDEMANLETRRHFVGIWLPDAVHAAGSDREGLYPLMRSTSSLASCPGTEFTLSNITVNAGKFLVVGGTIQLGRKDTHVTLESTLQQPFAVQMAHAAESSILLYGTDDKRGWLLDGASTVLHLTRAWMHKIWLQLDLPGSPTLKQVHRIQQTQSAIATLTENENLDIGIAHITTSEGENESKVGGSAHDSAQPQMAAEARAVKSSSWTVGTQALHTWQQIESLIDHLRQCRMKGIVFSSKRFNTGAPSLIGWDATKIGSPATSVDTQIVAVDSAGRHWCEWTRSSDIPTIFARTFGDLIVPRATTQSPMCRRARLMPHQQTLLAVPLEFLCQASSQFGEAVSTTNKCVRISDKYYWHDFIACDLDPCSLSGCQCVTISKIGTKRVQKRSLQSENSDDIISLYPNAVALINTCQRKLAKDKRNISHSASKKRKMSQSLSMRFTGRRITNDPGSQQSSMSTETMHHERATSINVESERGLELMELDNRSPNSLPDEASSSSREIGSDMDSRDEMEVIESRSRSDVDMNDSQTVSTSVVPSVQVSSHEVDFTYDESDNDMHPGYGPKGMDWLNYRR